MTFNQALSIIEQALSQEDLADRPDGLYAPIVYTLANGGKRLRPALTMMANDLFGGTAQQAVKAALGLEIFHNFTLLHDDIMDKAPIRRGKPSVHVKWNDNTAILSGDAMLIKAYQYVSDVPKDVLPGVLSVFSQTALEVCEGQQYDMDFETQPHVNEEEYLEMIRLKTAVLLGGSLKVGAIIGGASPSDQQALYDFGINLGLAFQLMDDWLDVYGNEKNFGKKTGGDITSNKKTFMLINALQKADGPIDKTLNTWLAKEEFVREEKVSAVMAVYDELNIGQLAKEKMEFYFQKSLTALEKVRLSEEKKGPLKDLALLMLNRKN